MSLMEQNGLKVRIDAVGNIFGRRRGSTREGVVMSGSHFDTVYNGGMFDGAMGTSAALELSSDLEKKGFEGQRKLEVVVFSSEEGSFFGRGTLGSSVFVRKVSVGEALA